MTNMVKNADVRTIAAGITVTKATSLVAQTLTSLFTITGGSIILVNLFGELTIANDGTATTITLGHTPSLSAVGSKPAALATATAITSKEIGTKIGLGATVAAALVVGTDASVPLLLPPRQIVGPGAITYTGAVGAGTASIKYSLTYVPLDTGVAVVAA